MSPCYQWIVLAFSIQQKQVCNCEANDIGMGVLYNKLQNTSSTSLASTARFTLYIMWLVDFIVMSYPEAIYSLSTL